MGRGADPRELIDFAVLAERLGYDSLWVNDSLLSPRIEALTMLAALTPVTDHLTLGTAALLPVLRRPVQAAQTLASIDPLSGGRLVVAVGAGFPGRFGRPCMTCQRFPGAAGSPGSTRPDRHSRPHVTAGATPAARRAHPASPSGSGSGCGAVAVLGEPCPGAAQGAFLAEDLPAGHSVVVPATQDVSEPAERAAAVQGIQQPLA